MLFSILSGLLFLLIAVMIYSPFRRGLFKGFQTSASTLNLISSPEEHWVNVFVHGSFGSLLGLLNVGDIVKDKIKGTNYKKLSKHFRRQPISYKDQPILQKGLVKVEPSFDLSVTNGRKFAAYPILKAYSDIDEAVNSNNHINHFYTFGWTGLLSQNRRRVEAIRLYNALQKEIDDFKSIGINPKIRILAHSHGGNLVLNLAAINKLLSVQDIENDKTLFLGNSDEDSSLRKMYLILKDLPVEKIAIEKKGQKKLSYIPRSSDMYIEEFVLLGTPIQPETECFFYYSNFFKRIFSFYSDQDHIQALDILSTKNDISCQRIALREGVENIFQIKITTSNSVDIFKSKKVALNSDIDEKVEYTSFFQKFLDRGNFFKKSNDPTHKELWFATWSQDDSVKKQTFGILPVVVFTPLFAKSVEGLGFSDVDLCLTVTNNKYVTSVVKHNDNEICKQSMIESSFIDEIKSKLLVWKPDMESFLKEFQSFCDYSG